MSNISRSSTILHKMEKNVTIPLPSYTESRLRALYHPVHEDKVTSSDDKKTRLRAPAQEETARVWPAGFMVKVQDISRNSTILHGLRVDG